MYWHKTPQIIQYLYPQLTWHKSRKEPVIYVTFDDGPIPEVTPAVLDVLNEHNAKATFFCVGDNVKKHPGVYNQVISAGHAIGNHTYNHINGWSADKKTYLDNVGKCAVHVPEALSFRPPYGKIKRNTIGPIAEKYDIIMWDVLAGDFDTQLNKEQCLSNTIKATKNGSIVIFHDSLKAQQSMLFALPRFLAHFANQGVKFLAL